MITIYLKQYNKIIRNADTGLFEELGYDDILWIDMLQPTIKEQKAVENFMEINLQTKQQVDSISSTCCLVWRLISMKFSTAFCSLIVGCSISIHKISS